MTAIATIALSLALTAPVAVERGTNPREAARDTLTAGIQEAAESTTVESRLAGLLDAGRAAAETLEDRRTARLVSSAVRDARWRAVSDREEAARRLEERLEELADDLAFEPYIEADLPVSFPAPTPVLEIELKQYPAYRVATAPMQGRRNGAFWTLFRHIKRHDIPMTAPVESTFAGGELRESRMGFLYQSPEVGSAGPDGDVEVIDVEPRWVVSMGCRGNTSMRRIEEARTELLRWIESREDLEVAGSLRTMGYNSPMVRAKRRYFEVQIPVRRTETL